MRQGRASCEECERVRNEDLCEKPQDRDVVLDSGSLAVHEGRHVLLVDSRHDKAKACESRIRYQSRVSCASCILTTINYTTASAEKGMRGYSHF